MSGTVAVVAAAGLRGGAVAVAAAAGLRGTAWSVGGALAAVSAAEAGHRREPVAEAVEAEAQLVAEASGAGVRGGVICQ